MRWSVKGHGFDEKIPEHIKNPGIDDETAEALAEQYFCDMAGEARFPVTIVIIDDDNIEHPFEVELEVVPQFYVIHYVSRQ